MFMFIAMCLRMFHGILLFRCMCVFLDMVMCQCAGDVPVHVYVAMCVIGMLVFRWVCMSRCVCLCAWYVYVYVYAFVSVYVAFHVYANMYVYDPVYWYVYVSTYGYAYVYFVYMIT